MAKKSEKKDGRILIHEGLFLKRLLYFPKVETFTLSSGWSDGKRVAFENAIVQVIKENPILTSHLVKENGSLYAVPGTYLPDQHSFVTVVDLSSATEHPQPLMLETGDERLQFCLKHVLPLVKHKQKFVAGEIKHKEALFSCLLFRFSDGFACYHISISHALADAYTYYRLVGQISQHMNGTGNNGTSPALQWLNTPLTTNELTLDHYSKKDLSKMGALPFLMGLSRRLHTIVTRKEHVLLLSRAKIELKKKELLSEENEFLSSHDIIITALCQLIDSADEFVVIMDARDRVEGMSKMDAGNCLKEFAIPCDVCAADPNAVRKAVNQGHFYGTDCVPGRAIRRGRLCYASNWTTSARHIQGVTTVCHVPTLAFLKVPFDVAIIFSFDKDCIGVAHNFLSQSPDTATLLLEIVM